jgi:hypothetical protein
MHSCQLVGGKPTERRLRVLSCIHSKTPNAVAAGMNESKCQRWKKLPGNVALILWSVDEHDGYGMWTHLNEYFEIDVEKPVANSINFLFPGSKLMKLVRNLFH